MQDAEQGRDEDVGIMRRMEEGLRRALTTPHKPLTKFKGKSAATGQRKRKTKTHPVKKG